MKREANVKMAVGGAANNASSMIYLRASSEVHATILGTTTDRVHRAAHAATRATTLDATYGAIRKATR